MDNLYKTKTVIIESFRDETPMDRLFKLRFKDPDIQKNFSFKAGQFVEISLPGWGEAPVGILSSAAEKNYFEILVRRIGRVTTRLHQLKAGEELGARGPYGNGFPIEKFQNCNLLLMAGGTGIVPVSAAIYALISQRDKCGRIQLFYGARTPQDLLLQDRYDFWKQNGVEICLTVDKLDPTFKKFVCEVGVVTTLFDKVKVAENSIGLVVGPPIMFKFSLERLKKIGIADENIYLSLERRMQCALGICQHCAVGPYYVCKDGPVFSWAQLRDIPDVF
jgi:NAD(P)H-flavin reductase